MAHVERVSNPPQRNLAVALLMLVGLVGGCATTMVPVQPGINGLLASASPISTQTIEPSGGPVSLASLLERLVVASEHREGYERDLFPHWIDEDGNGCNTRYEVLIKEAVVAPAVVGSCDLIGGSWLSPYDDVRIDGAAGVQIDHLVPLAEAWYSGAWAWTTPRRQEFANDLGVSWALVAVSPAVNEAKAASDPAKWLPPSPEAVCPYVSAWIAMKFRWSLTVDIDEREALDELVVRCPSQQVAVPSIQ